MFSILYVLLCFAVPLLGFLPPQEEHICEPPLMYKNFAFNLVQQRCQDLFCLVGANDNGTNEDNITSAVWFADSMFANWKIIFKCVCLHNDDGIVFKHCDYPTNVWFMSTFARNEDECKNQQRGQNYTFHCDLETGDATCLSEYEWLSSFVSNSGCNKNFANTSSANNLLNNQTDENNETSFPLNEKKVKSSKKEECNHLCNNFSKYFLLSLLIIAVLAFILICYRKERKQYQFQAIRQQERSEVEHIQAIRELERADRKQVPQVTIEWLCTESTIYFQPGKNYVNCFFWQNKMPWVNLFVFSFCLEHKKNKILESLL